MLEFYLHAKKFCDIYMNEGLMNNKYEREREENIYNIQQLPSIRDSSKARKSQLCESSEELVTSHLRIMPS